MLGFVDIQCQRCHFYNGGERVSESAIKDMPVGSKFVGDIIEFSFWGTTLSKFPNSMVPTKNSKTNWGNEPSGTPNKPNGLQTGLMGSKWGEWVQMGFICPNGRYEPQIGLTGLMCTNMEKGRKSMKKSFDSHQNSISESFKIIR